MKHERFITREDIHPYSYRGLAGRYIYLPALDSKSKRVFLVVYGQHASIERLLPTLEALREFGLVYLVDTPGFGGMDPPYKVGEKPTLDFYSDHIRNIFDSILPTDKKITVFAISYGLEITSYFLALHPTYQNRIEDVVSFVGLVSHTNFRISSSLRFLLKYVVAGPGRTKLGAWFYTHFVFQDWILKFYYRHIMAPRRGELNGATRQQIEDYAAEQSWLWRVNDPRTHGQTAWDFLFVCDLTFLGIDLPIIHAGVRNDHFLDDTDVVRCLKKMYRSVQRYEMTLHGHAPVSIDSSDAVLDMIPDDLKRKMVRSVN